MSARPPPKSTRYREIYERIRNSITEGRLRPGDRLPSARALAGELNVARGTVDTAYALLVGEGFLISHSRTATVVAPAIPTMSAALHPVSEGPPRQDPPDPAYHDIITVLGTVRPLMPGLPSFDLFPRKLWAHLVARQARRLDVAGLTYPDGIGERDLREALAAYLGVARGVRCEADQIVITGGYQAAAGLIAQLVLRPGESVWTESPGYRLTRLAAASSGGQVIRVPVDRDGLNVEIGMALAPDARLCMVCPSNEFPLGVTMSLPRRLALLEWAERNAAWIVEDDYGGEFRYDGFPLPALKSLDRGDRVFHVGTFSKTMFPGLRLGYVVAPMAQLQALKSAARSLDGGRPGLEQRVMAEFLAEGHFARHIKKMRLAYQARRNALVEALTAKFGSRFVIQSEAGGLSLLLTPSGVENVELLEAAARAHDLRPLAVRVDDRSPDKLGGLLLGFANTPESQAAAVVERLAAAFAEVG